VANQNDVRRIARKLPGTSEGEGRFAFSVRNGSKEKAFVWVWSERIAPRKARVPNPDVLAVRVADLDEKDALLAIQATPDLRGWTRKGSSPSRITTASRLSSCGFR
jgi:hypothetical protein